MQRKIHKQVIFVIILLCLALPLFSQRSKKITWGVYGGWSWGTGYAFRWHYRPYSDRYIPRFHLGGYVQLNLSPHFGVQLDANYQNLLNEWTFDHPSFPYSSGEDSLGFASLGLKGIVNFPKWGMFQPYIAAGGGINWGDWYELSGSYFHLVGSPGVKLFLWKSHSHMALILRCSFMYLFDTDYGDYENAFIIRLNFGIEF